MPREITANWPALARKSRETDPSHPLSDFYELAGLPVPHIETLPGPNIPEPYRKLLVHENDMTGTLEQYHDNRIHLRVLHSKQLGKLYYREVVLQLDHSAQAAGFGATKLDLRLYPAEAQRLILKDYVPLGSILAQFQIAYTCHPSAYLRIQPDESIATELNLGNPVPLYGRRNTLKNARGAILAELIEILPPV